MKRTPLQRKTPLRRKKRSYRTVDEREFYLDQRQVRASHAGGRCEAGWHPGCPNGDGDYGRVWMQAHHVHTTQKGGSDDWTNLRWVCEFCHNLIHARPNEARERGLLE